MLFVGDSTVFQLFLSFVLLLHARLGKSAKRASTVSEMTASACDDTVRLAFSRSDLLLWTGANSDFNSVKRCDGFTNLQVYLERAVRDADVLVLGVRGVSCGTSHSGPACSCCSCRLDAATPCKLTFVAVWPLILSCT